MKKLSSFFFIYLIIAIGYSQQPDVITLFELDNWNGSNWEQQSRQNFIYNNNCLSTEIINELLNANTGNFENSSRSIFTLNSDDLTEIITNQAWDATNSQWTNQSKSQLFYTGTNATELRSYLWTNGAWQITGRTILTYNTANLVTENISQTFDTTNNIYINSSKADITYNSNDLIDAFTSLFWNATGMVWENSSRQTSSYTNNLISSRQTEIWNNNAWENSQLENLTHDNNDFLIESITQFWNGSIYEDNLRFIYTNDANGNRTETITQVSISTVWTNLSRSKATFSQCLASSIEEFSDIDFNVYPNPVSNQLQINSEATFSGKISLVDPLGRVLFSEQVIANQNSIDVSQYAEGIYFLVIESQGQRTTKQISIKN